MRAKLLSKITSWIWLAFYVNYVGSCYEHPMLTRNGWINPQSLAIKNAVVPKAIIQPSFLVPVACATNAAAYAITKAPVISDVQSNPLIPAWWMAQAMQSPVQGFNPIFVNNSARKSWLVKKPSMIVDTSKSGPATHFRFGWLLLLIKTKREANATNAKNDSKGYAAILVQDSGSATVFRTVDCQYDSNEVFAFYTNAHIW